MFLYLCKNHIICTMMYTRAFNKMSELNDFVNDEGIPQERIVNIFQTKDSLYVLVYYAE